MILSKDKEFIELEKLRRKVLNIDQNDLDIINSYFYNRLKEGLSLGLGIKKDNKIISGAIVSYFFESLLIEWIFTDEKYRNKGYAKEIIKYIEDNINIFETYYNKKIKRIQLESLDDSKGFYEKQGFNETKIYMIKRIKK